MATSDLAHNPAVGVGPPPEEQPPAGNDKRASLYPVHPIAQLQRPFEESILETNEGSENQWVVNLDAQSRRRDLLENDDYERLCGRKWRQKTTER